MSRKEQMEHDIWWFTKLVRVQGLHTARWRLNNTRPWPLYYGDRIEYLAKQRGLI